ncbi:MAG: tyrosine recombinase [Phycisphaerales bacterium]
MPTLAHANPAPPVARFLAFLRIECGLSVNTLLAYERDLSDLGADLAEHGVSDSTAATTADLIGHITRLRTEKRLASTSIARHLATIRMFFRWHTSETRQDQSPADLLERPSMWQRLPDVLSKSNVRALLEAPDLMRQESTERDPVPIWKRDRAMLETMYACGLRASEVCALGRNDMMNSLGVLRVTGKGDKQRLVPYGKPAEESLLDYLAVCRPRLVKPDGRDRDRIFLSRTGRPLERVAVWQIVTKHASAAGLRDVHPHTMRHTFATHLLTGGADLRVVQELLGHASIATTQIYTRVDQPRLKEVHRRFHPRG